MTTPSVPRLYPGFNGGSVCLYVPDFEQFNMRIGSYPDADVVTKTRVSVDHARTLTTKIDNLSVARCTPNIPSVGDTRNKSFRKAYGEIQVYGEISLTAEATLRELEMS